MSGSNVSGDHASGAGAGAGQETDRGARRYDVIVYGATGFTGGLVAEYLAQRYAQQYSRTGGAVVTEGTPLSRPSTSSTIRWAIAGRSEASLRRRQTQLATLAGHTIDIVIADARDAASVTAMVRQTRVVLSTVGPFMQYGESLVKACASEGTSYVDSTGESPWVADMIRRYDSQAKATEALIVPMCGFDSIPSDLGTLLAVNHMRTAYGAATALVESSVDIRGAASGGTVYSAMGLMETADVRRQLDNPHALCVTCPPLAAPSDSSSVDDTLDPASVTARLGPPKGVSWDSTLRTWRTRFVMSQVNEQVVRRSAFIAAQRGQRYADGLFQYREHMAVKWWLLACLISITLWLGDFFLRLAPFRALLKLGFTPGTGPSRGSMAAGYMRVRLVATSEEPKPHKAVVVVSGDSDPGYSLTAQMLAESALTIACAKPKCPGRSGGVFTPATGLGVNLVDRLNAHSDIRLVVAS